MSEGRGAFGRIGFILAAAGSAIGLGNIWKFPYITYANNGGSFVLIYLAAVCCIGIPMIFAEILLGRYTQKNAVGAFAQVAKEQGRSPLWAGVGWLGIAAGFVILSYYSVVAGWTVYYFGKCLMWSLNGFTPDDAANLGGSFTSFLGNGGAQIGLHALFMALTVGVVIMGVKAGIERTAKILMPLLFGILFVLAAVATTWPGFGDAMHFMFHLGPISWTAVLEAVGHSFFTLSLGMGAMLTYGSYLSSKDSVPRAGLMVCLLDTTISLLACIVMFSIIFSVPEADRAGTFSKSATILFTTLPRMFYSLPGGTILAPAFYVLVALAALTSTISLLEVVVAYFIDQLGWTRHKAAGLVGLLIFIIGIPSALSLGAVESLSTLWGHGWFGAFDYLATNWMLPVGGLLTAVFVAWRMPASMTHRALEEGHGTFAFFRPWRLILGVITPIAIGWIIVMVITGRTF